MKAKFGPLEKNYKKRQASIEMKFSKTAGTPFLTTNGNKKFWKS
jgi:hypothetical protein